MSSPLPLRRSRTVWPSMLDCIFFTIGFDFIDAVRSNRRQSP